MTSYPAMQHTFSNSSMRSSTTVQLNEQDVGWRLHRGPAGPGVASGLVCGLLNMALGISLAAVVFQAVPQYIMLGFDCSSLGIFLACVALTLFSSCPVYMGCPNAVAALVFSDTIARMVKELDDPSQQSQIVPTVMVSVALCTFITGCVFALVGILKVTKYLEVFPQPVMSGFLAAIGAGLLKYSMKIGGRLHPSAGFWILSPDIESKEFWYFYWPVFPLGVSLFLFHRFDVLHPTILWSVFLAGPLVVFYLIAALTEPFGPEWFMDPMERVEFYEIWTIGYDVSSVRWDTVLNSVFQFVPLIPVILVDVLIGMAATRKAGSLDMDLDGDASLTGFLFMLQSVLMSPLTTNSGKLSILNVSIAGTRSRLPTAIAGAFALFLFMLPPIVIPYFPRFYLGYLLLFNGLGFLVKNLWDARHHMTKMDVLVPWIMVMIDMLFGLVGAIGYGMLCATILFALKFSKVDCVRAISPGCVARKLVTRHIRSPIEEVTLHYATRQLTVVELQSYLFFGCALQLSRVVQDIVDSVLDVSNQSMRVRWLIVDFEHVSGMDATLAASFAALVRKLVSAGLTIVVTGFKKANIESKLRAEGALAQVSSIFPDLSEGIAFVEDQMLARTNTLHKRWLRTAGSTIHRKNYLSQLQFKHHILLYLINDHVEDMWRFVRRRVLSHGMAACNMNEACKCFFVVQSGVLVEYDEDGNKSKVLHKGACFNHWALLLQAETALHTVRAESDQAVVWEVDVSVASTSECWRQFEQLAMRQELALAMRSIAAPSTSKRGRIERRQTMQMLTSSVQRTVPEPQLALPSPRTIRDCFAKMSGPGSSVLPASDVPGALMMLGCDIPPEYREKISAEDLNEAEFAALVNVLPRQDTNPLQGAFGSLSGSFTFDAKVLLEAIPGLSAFDADEMVEEMGCNASGQVPWVNFFAAVRFVH